MLVDKTANQGTRMSILCAILQYDPGAAEDNSFITNPRRTVFPVTFQVPDTNEYMECSKAKITVQSVRWPHNRITTPERPLLPLLNILKGSSCVDGGGLDGCGDRTIDAAVWVMPLCGGGYLSPVCLQESVLTSCYPFCLAVRKRSTYNSALTLYSAPTWKDRVHLFNMDCATQPFRNETQNNPIIVLPPQPLAIAQLPPTQRPQGSLTIADLIASIPNSLGGGRYPRLDSGAVIETILSSDILGSTLRTPFETEKGVYCIQSNLATTILPIEFFRDRGEYGDDSFRSTLASEQPFVFAGDTALVQDDNCTPQKCSVLVYRIYGSDAGHMTLVNTGIAIPSKPPPTTPRELSDINDLIGQSQNFITIPFGLTNLPWSINPAVATEEAVFYAVNPYWQVYTALIEYCNDDGNPGKLGKLQLVVASSFSPITIWRVYPYIYCPPSREVRVCFSSEILCLDLRFYALSRVL